MSEHLKYAFLQFVNYHQLIRAQQRVLVALSGGVDSVVLLDLLRTWQGYFQLELGVAHLNHTLRGEESDRDEEFVRELAGRYSLPFFPRRVDVRAYARQQRYSLEEAGRRLRQQFLEDIAEQERFDAIATGHHLDDQAETILMRLLRGVGVEGLAGIRVKKGRFVRPLLFAARQDILRYAQKQQLDFREDASNTDLNFERNRIRHRLLPFLRREFDYFRPEHLFRLGMIVQDWEEFIAEESERLYKTGVKPESQNKIRLDMTIYQNYFSGIQIKLIKMIFENLNQPHRGLTYQQFQSFRQWVSTAQSGSKFCFSEQLRVRKSRTELIFELGQIDQAPSGVSLHLMPGDVYQDEARKIWLALELAEWNAGQALPGEPGVEYLDASGLEFPLKLRSRAAGDRFRPLGMKQSKKLSDFLSNESNVLIPRDQAIVLENKGEIVYVVGLRISDRYKVSKKTKKTLIIRYGVL